MSRFQRKTTGFFGVDTKRVQVFGLVEQDGFEKEFRHGSGHDSVLQKRILDQLERLTGNIILSSHLASNPYTIQEFLTDLYNGAFENTVKGRALTDADKMLQQFIVDVSASSLKEAGGGSVADVDGCGLYAFRGRDCGLWPG